MGKVEKRNRKGNIVLGGQRCGKSHYLNLMSADYIQRGGSVIIYNLGKESDFKSCKYGRLLNKKAHFEYIRDTEGLKAAKSWVSYPEFLYFQVNGVVYSIKEFNSDFYRTGLKFGKIDKEMEGLFFESVHKYVSNTFVVFDDAKSVFNANLRAWQVQLLGSMNHSGTEHISRKYVGQGVDCAFVFHSLNMIPTQLLEYYTDDYYFICFKYKEEPKFDRITDYELRAWLESSFEMLSKAPQYSKSIFTAGKHKDFITKL